MKINGIEVNIDLGLKYTLNQLQEIETTFFFKSISGSIFNINNSLYILAKVEYHYSENLEDIIDNLKWCLIRLRDGNRYYEPLTLEELFQKLLELAHRGDVVKLVGHMEEYIDQLHKILGIKQ